MEKLNKDVYEVYYNMNETEVNDRLNKWFIGDNVSNKKIIISDVLCTFKKMDEETQNRLYYEEVNPITLSIFCPLGAKFLFNDDGEELYEMKCQIHSKDDNSYGIWWCDKNQRTLSQLKSIREKIKKYIDENQIINGEDFLRCCIKFGANPDSVDYN